MDHGKTKKTRSSTQKVRTGCITCKKRHIKCDENKPHCNNCLKARGHCEGYATEAPKKVTGPIELRWDLRHGGLKAAPKLEIQLQVHPDSVDFRDSTAHLYFHEFVGLVQGPWLNATSKDDLWRVTIPQLARNNDIFRSAAMAIGALNLWHCHSGRKSLHAVSVPERLVAAEDKHYFHAMAYYCHSLKLHRHQRSPQDAIFLSLLLMFFESLRGNRRAVLDHINHALTLLLTLLTDQNSHLLIASVAPNPKPFLAAVAGVFTLLSAQVRTVLRGRIGQGISLPNLAKELNKRNHSMETFMCLLSRMSCPPINNRIPAVFNTLDEFEQYWASGSHRHTKMISIMADALQASAAKFSTNQDVDDYFFLQLLGNSRVEEFCKNSQKEFELLNAAFLPLFDRIIMTDIKSPTYLRALYLRLDYLASYVIEDPTSYLMFETLRSKTPVFRELLSLANTILRVCSQEARNPAYRLSLQSGLVWHIFNVAFLCRDPLTRDEALWILRDYPGQDGLWSTRSLYMLAMRNRDIERTNAQEGTPDEQWRRLCRREFVFEDGGNRILFRYLDRDQESRDWQMVEEAAETGPGLENVEWIRQPLPGSIGLLMAEMYCT